MTSSVKFDHSMEAVSAGGEADHHTASPSAGAIISRLVEYVHLIISSSVHSIAENKQNKSLFYS